MGQDLVLFGLEPRNHNPTILITTSVPCLPLMHSIFHVGYFKFLEIKIRVSKKDQNEKCPKRNQKKIFLPFSICARFFMVFN